MSSVAGAGVENWGPRAQSAASVSSNEWMQVNATTASTSSNGNLASSISNDPWLSKPPPNISNDAWQSSKSAVIDPWAPSANNMGSRPSPIGAQISPNSDYDEFDVISNRAKTQNANNNNIASNSK